MFEEVSKHLNVWNDDPILAEAVAEFLKTSQKLMEIDPCLICGGRGHETGLKCSTVKVLLTCAEKAGRHADAELFRHALGQELTSYLNLSNWELGKQQSFQDEFQTLATSNCRFKTLAQMASLAAPPVVIKRDDLQIIPG